MSKEEFYQSTFRAAKQIITAVKEGKVATPSYRPAFLDDRDYIYSIRQLCKQAIYARWNNEQQVSSLYDVYRWVKARIQDLIKTGEWNVNLHHVPGKRSVDRRTNETADARLYETGIPPCISIGRGIYIPNPALFDEDTRTKLLSFHLTF